MQKINKTCSLSTAYKAWEEDLELRGVSHGTYDSSSNEYYLDVVMNLFCCQGGLCAYTETRLCPSDLYQSSKWTADGKYDISPGKPEFSGQLEHFDSTLKTNKAWLWLNLFMAHTDINVKIKKWKPAPTILKPDRDDYDPFTYLYYDVKSNIFIPHPDLDEDTQAAIYKDILILGVNYGIIVDRRRIFIAEKLAFINLGAFTWDNIEIYEFPTSFQMVKQQMTA